jgi:nicotinamide mononucleotide (NMN) deamidase PncC
MLLLVFKDGSSTQFCSFEAENIAKLLQVTNPCFTHTGAVSSHCCSAMLLLITEGGVG